MEALLVVGIVALVLGIALLYWINRRKFYRRNAFGSEGFSSYEKSLAVTFVERVGKWIAYALIIIGLLFLWAHSRQQKDLDKKEQAMQTIKYTNVLVYKRLILITISFKCKQMGYCHFFKVNSYID